MIERFSGKAKALGPNAMTDDYYIRRKAKLLRQFDRFFRRVRRRLEARYDADVAEAVATETRSNFEEIIPQLPYIGGRGNAFTPVIVANGWIVALYRAMTARGESEETVIRLCCEVSDDLLRSFPGFVLRLAGRVASGPLGRWYLGRQAARSQRRQYPEDFVYSFLKGDGAEFDYALEFSECAVDKFYEAQGVQELGPYCNFFDITCSRHMKLGLNADTTIGLGHDRCSMRFKKGGETKIPARLEGILPVDAHTGG